LVARLNAEWSSLKDEPTAVEESRRAMGMLAQGLSNYLGALAAMSEDATSSALYNRILMQSQKASQLARFRLYLDGGDSWRKFQEGCDEVLDALANIAGDDWTL
jgi:hypothetical protein